MIEKKVPCEIWSRVVGFFRPIDHFNRGKKEEFSERKTISMESINEAIK
jgi:anaerobic ribonucleoside-triphosphate reductase